ncbi:MAG: hypothetical protein JG767_113 [Deferribacteraceae bacterium]|jgi:hypothetical protein|nr:hypothetical protein [Deferribacteraceae bacterium]
MEKELSDKAQLIAKKYKYKELILKKKVKLKTSMVKKLVGPDCAYHLYSFLKNGEN